MTPTNAFGSSALRIAALVIAGSLALASCSPAEETPGASASPSSEPSPVTEPSASIPTDPSPTTPAEPLPPVEVPDVLQFSTVTVADGAAFEGASLAGQNTIFWFWAPWCPNCQAESSAIAEAADELPDGVRIIGVAGRAEVADMQAFLDEYGVDNFDHIVDEDGSIWEAFNVPYQPAYAFMDNDGSFRTVIGAMGKDGVLNNADALLATP